jgi:hypothetical protein
MKERTLKISTFEEIARKYFGIRTCSLLAGTVPNILQKEVSALVPAPEKYHLKHPVSLIRNNLFRIRIPIFLIVESPSLAPDSTLKLKEGFF